MCIWEYSPCQYYTHSYSFFVFRAWAWVAAGHSRWWWFTLESMYICIFLLNFPGWPLGRSTHVFDMLNFCKAQFSHLYQSRKACNIEYHDAPTFLLTGSCRWYHNLSGRTPFIVWISKWLVSFRCITKAWSCGNLNPISWTQGTGAWNMDSGSLIVDSGSKFQGPHPGS